VSRTGRPLVAGGLLAAALVAASPATAQAAPCAGTQLAHDPVRVGGTVWGYVDVYYRDGVNCAQLNKVGSVRGVATYMELILRTCSQRSPGPTCTTVDYDNDYGTYEYYAGPVRVTAPNQCIAWNANIQHNGRIAAKKSDPFARNCA
jgi:hypothetical protein